MKVRPATVLCTSMLLLATALTTGCKTETRSMGESTETRYKGRTLITRYPDTVRVPTVFAALDELLRDRGYTVIETSMTEDQGKMVVRAPRYNTYPRVVIEVKQTATACVVNMRNEPFGDQEQVEQLMSALTARLGI